ncbi:MAG: hypothetical protein R2843_11435 [Thermomicrobiales bacterium]
MPEDVASADSQAISSFIEENAPSIDGMTIERGSFYFATSGAPWRKRSASPARS